MVPSAFSSSRGVIPSAATVIRAATATATIAGALQNQRSSSRFELPWRRRQMAALSSEAAAMLTSAMRTPWRSSSSIH
jgi:hypothetical protein